MPLLDANGQPLPAEGPPPELTPEQVERMWAPIDMLINQARAQFKDQSVEQVFLVRREQLVMTLLPGANQLWAMFAGQAKLKANSPAGQALVSMLCDAGLQVLLQWRMDMREGEMIAARVMSARDAASAPPDAPPAEGRPPEHQEDSTGP